MMNYSKSTTNFRFCLYDNEHSEKNCTSGLFSSLPLESRQALWTRVFDTEFQNTIASTKSTVNLSVRFVVVGALLLIVASFLFFGVLLMSWQRLRKRWTENNTVSLPYIDEEMLVVDNHNLKPKKKKYKSDAEIENLGLLQMETECNLSCNSGETSSTGYASDAYDDTRSQSDSSENGVNNSAKCLLAGGSEESVVLKQKSVIHCEKDVDEKSAIRPDTVNVNPVKLKETKRYNVEKRNVIVLQYPNKIPGQDDSPDDAADPLTVQVSAANSSHLDIMRLSWTQIFLFLMKQISPSKYTLFFNLLLDKAGCNNTAWVIESVECNKKGKTEDIMLKLFQIWKEGARSNAKPKDIEDVFEALEWNAQLSDFREYMRNPPYLPEENNWNEQSLFISSENMTGEAQRLFLHQRSIPQIEELDGTYERQPQTNGTAISSEKVAEHISVANHNGIDLVESKKLTCRRSIIRRRDNDLNEINSKYRKVENLSPSNMEYNKRFRHIRRRNTCNSKYRKVVNLSSSNMEDNKRFCHVHRRNTCKIQSLKRKQAVDKTFVSSPCKKTGILPQASSSSQSTTSATATSSALSSSEKCNEFSSGYGSMSLSDTELESEQTLSNTTWNGNISEDTFSKYEDSKSRNKTELLSNSLRYSNNSERSRQSPSLTCQKTQACHRSKELSSEAQNGKSLLGMPCRSTLSSWNVSSTERPLLNSSSITEPVKRKRNISNHYPLGTKKQMVSKKKSKSFKHTRKPRKKRKLSGNEDLKSAKLAGVIKMFIDDLLARMVPSREDILSLKFQSYSDADCLLTSWNERIYIIFSEKHCLPVREGEWSTLQAYVNNVRSMVTKTGKRYCQNRELLFLNHNGEPII